MFTEPNKLSRIPLGLLLLPPVYRPVPPRSAKPSLTRLPMLAGGLAGLGVNTQWNARLPRMMLLRKSLPMFPVLAYTPATCGQERADGTACAQPPKAVAEVAVLSLFATVLLMMDTALALSIQMPPARQPATLLMTMLLVMLTTLLLPPPPPPPPLRNSSAMPP